MLPETRAALCFRAKTYALTGYPKFCIGLPVVRTDGRSVGHVITKFSGMGRFIYPWCSAGALRARSSAIIIQDAPAVTQPDRLILFKWMSLETR